MGEHLLDRSQVARTDIDVGRADRPDRQGRRSPRSPVDERSSSGGRAEVLAQDAARRRTPRPGVSRMTTETPSSARLAARPAGRSARPSRPREVRRPPRTTASVGRPPGEQVRVDRDEDPPRQRLDQRDQAVARGLVLRVGTSCQGKVHARDQQQHGHLDAKDETSRPVVNQLITTAPVRSSLAATPSEQRDSGVGRDHDVGVATGVQPARPGRCEATPGHSSEVAVGDASRAGHRLGICRCARPGHQDDQRQHQGQRRGRSPRSPTSSAIRLAAQQLADDVLAVPPVRQSRCPPRPSRRTRQRGSPRPTPAASPIDHEPRQDRDGRDRARSAWSGRRGSNRPPTSDTASPGLRVRRRRGRLRAAGQGTASPRARCRARRPRAGRSRRTTPHPTIPPSQLPPIRRTIAATSSNTAIELTSETSRNGR